MIARFDSAEDAAQWRAALRRACRSSGLRVRTGLAEADDRIAWAHHIDHVVTEAGRQAANQTIEDLYSDEPPVLPQE